VGRFHPLFIVTPDLRLLDLNLAGEALLRAGGEILVTSGQFCFADKPRTAQLKALLDGGGTGTAGWSYRRADGEFVVVHIEWLPSDSVDGEEPLVALTFPPCDGAARYVWAEFAHHFDLTRSESAIVKRLVEGQTPTAIAEELGLSIETVRTHIRRTYNKLGISCREQLFSAIVPFRLG
jgi:DNA-binding CsgD family transcriptional regulator